MEWEQPILMTSNTVVQASGPRYSEREKGESQLSVFSLLPGPPRGELLSAEKSYPPVASTL